MTDVSDDEEEESENPFDDAPSVKSPIKMKPLQGAAAAKLQAKRRTEALRRLNDPRFAALGGEEGM
jgi:hypothetical protein